ncbi:MAG TPA: hypothetical protein VIF12_06270 [Micavibrio sp.]|jgi:hypothetical protein
MKSSKALVAALAMAVCVAGAAVDSFATEDQDSRVCAELSKNPKVSYFKELKLVQGNVLAAEFCTKAVDYNFPRLMPATTFYLEEQLQYMLTDDRLSQEQVRQYGIARAKLMMARELK